MLHALFRYLLMAILAIKACSWVSKHMPERVKSYIRMARVPLQVMAVLLFVYIGYSVVHDWQSTKTPQRERTEEDVKAAREGRIARRSARGARHSNRPMSSIDSLRQGRRSPRRLARLRPDTSAVADSSLSFSSLGTRDPTDSLIVIDDQEPQDRDSHDQDP